VCRKKKKMQEKKTSLPSLFLRWEANFDADGAFGKECTCTPAKKCEFGGVRSAKHANVQQPSNLKKKKRAVRKKRRYWRKKCVIITDTSAGVHGGQVGIDRCANAA